MIFEEKQNKYDSVIFLRMTMGNVCFNYIQRILKLLGNFFAFQKQGPEI